MHIRLLAIAVITTVTLFAATASPARADEIIPVPRFDSVALNGGGSVTVVPAPFQRVILRSGSPAYTRFTVRPGGSLEIRACQARCPRDYRVDVEIQTPNVDAVAVSSGGSLRFAPAFAAQREMSVAVSSGGSIDMRNLRVAQISAAVDSGGSIELGAPAELSAAVNSGGSIRYRGRPQLRAAIASGGSIERAE